MASAHSGRSTPDPYSYGVNRDEPEFDSDEELSFPGPPVEIEMIDTWRRNGPKPPAAMMDQHHQQQQQQQQHEHNDTDDKEKEERKKQERLAARIAMGASPNGTFTNCPPQTGKIKNQYSARKSVSEALADCGDDEGLKKRVLAATECEEYQVGKSVPADLLTALCEVVGVRSQSRCRFPNCGKLNVRTDRAKEHARVHIGNHPFSCTKIQADETVGCGATFLRKHDRNRHNNGADVLTCEDCGASIQGKGREYNLQRHKSNYCPVRKAARQTDLFSGPGDGDGSTSTQPSSTDSGSSGPHLHHDHDHDHLNSHANGTGTGTHHGSSASSNNGNGTPTPPESFHTGPPPAPESFHSNTGPPPAPIMANAGLPTVVQVFGPVPASTSLPMGMGMGVSVSAGNGGQGVEV